MRQTESCWTKGYVRMSKSRKEKVIVLFDGYCNFCVGVVMSLKFINILFRSESSVAFISIHKSTPLIKKYKLNINNLKSEIHIISQSGQTYRGSKAITFLTNYFPELSLILKFFDSRRGEIVYQWIAKNRYALFGCNNACTKN